MRDQDQVPHTKERAGQEHEEDAAGDKSSRNVLAASFLRDSILLFYQFIHLSSDFRSSPWKYLNLVPAPNFANG